MILLALDANSIINRAFYGIRPLSTKEGIPTNAVYGFMNILNKLIETVKPDVIAAAFDLKAPTFRHKMFDQYKAGRRPMPDELARQMPIMKDLLKAFGCIVYEKEGFEADDILGTLAKISDDNNCKCFIATGDRDSLQLVSENVHVLLAATKAGRPEITEYDPEKIMEKYGVAPPEMIEIKALQGDSSDNIPGVAGVGEKTAGTLISKYHSIDYIYDNIAQLNERDTLKNKLLGGKESAYLSRRLGTICRDVPIEFEFDSNYLKLRDDGELVRLLVWLEMNKLLEKMGLDSKNAAVTDEAQAVKTSEENVKIEFNSAAEIPNGSVICIDEKCEKIFARCGNDFFAADYSPDLLKSAENLTVYDSKSMYHKLELDFFPSIACDAMIAAYLISPDQSDYLLSRYALQYGIEKPEGEYADAAFELNVISAMHDDMMPQLEEHGQMKLFSEIEIPLSYTLYRMECAGFAVDKQGIEHFSEMLAEQIDKLQKSVYDIIGYEFNINSPKQLGVALFEKLGLPCRKKTKTGYSTSADVLEELRYESDAVEFILQYRKLSKLKSTYCEGLIKQIDETGRIHSTLKQTETRTGRISSAEPNLQNIPVRTELGREMRKFFTSSDEKTLVDADYSQIELRVLASVANDENMINAFASGEDIHAITASQVFNVPLDEVTPELRTNAKAVNFGIVYGIGAFSLSKDIHVSVAQARQYIKDYLETYHGVRDYLDKTVEDARQKGYVSTVFGRRRYLPDLASKNKMIQAFGERVAKNMPIQGTAADIIKIAMINVDRRLEAEKLPARLIMQIHDELIVECDESIAEKVCEILKSEMENAVSFAVKMKVDVHSGKTWYDAK